MEGDTIDFVDDIDRWDLGELLSVEEETTSDSTNFALRNTFEV